MIPRSVVEDIKPWLGTNKILILKGARRCGKTEVLHTLQKYMDDRGENTMLMSTVRPKVWVRARSSLS